jgi:hypothetical protein
MQLVFRPFVKRYGRVDLHQRINPTFLASLTQPDALPDEPMAKF